MNYYLPTLRPDVTDRTLTKIARREGQNFDCAPCVHKAQEMPREEFKREVERHLTGKETERWEILYFKACKSQLPVIEQARQPAPLMLGSDKSRGYRLEMICVDFPRPSDVAKDATS